MIHSFDVPFYFRDDLFSLVGEARRPPYRWFLVGPERSGSSLHLDPLSTSAWNTLLFGVKRWVLFPPSCARRDVKGDHLRRPGEDNEAITYFTKILPRIKEDERNKPNGPTLGMREVTTPQRHTSVCTHRSYSDRFANLCFRCLLFFFFLLSDHAIPG